MIDKSIPKNLRECCIQFQQTFSEEEINKFKSLNPGDLILLHFDLGLYIRNCWLYPKGSPLMEAFTKLNLIAHRDSLSSLLMKVIWLSLNGEEIDEEGLKRLFESHCMFYRDQPPDSETIKQFIG